MAENSAHAHRNVPVGIVGVGLHGEQRQVPADEPPPLPPNAELAVIGKPHPRTERPGQGHRRDPLHGRRRAAGPAHWRVSCARLMRTPRCAPSIRPRLERDPRVRAIVRAIKLDDPAHAVVRYVGQPVGRRSRRLRWPRRRRRFASSASTYRPLPFVVDIDEARRPESAKVYDASVRARKFGRRDRRPGRAAARRQRARPGHGAPRRRRARLRERRRRRRRRIPHAGADALLHGAARARRRLAPRRTDRLHVDPVYDRGAPRTRQGVRPAAREGAGGRRRHGRRLRLEVDPRQLRPPRGRALPSGGRAGAAHADTTRGAGRLGQSASDRSAYPDRRAARRVADADFGRKPRHRRRRARRRDRQFRPVAL